MKHSIISWDCCYRNYFHIFEGLSNQNYDKRDFELIFVEQRSKSLSSQFNNQYGLDSLYDTFLRYQDKIDVKILFLEDQSPYHLGKCVNYGFRHAEGDIISIMDGDMLLTSNFLKDLSDFHSSSDRIANIFRHSAQYPIGVWNFKNWTSGKVPFKAVYFASPTANDKGIYNKDVMNYGPMVSAKRECWEKIGGYDEHTIWSTSVSKIHKDANKRLEKLLGCKSKYLVNSYAVHPWHPIGVSERFRVSNEKNLGKEILRLQGEVLKYTDDQKVYECSERLSFVNKLYEENKDLFDEIIVEEEVNGKISLLEINDSWDKSTLPFFMRALKRRIKALFQ